MVNKDVKDLASGGRKSRPKARRKGAVRRTKKKPLPRWVWLLWSTVALLLVAGGYLLGSAEGPPPRQAATEAHPPAPTKAPAPVQPEASAEGAAAEEEASRFEFYHLLSKLEVVIPDSEIKKLQEDLAPREDVSYLLQAGSFRRFDDADSVKAQLAFLGIEAEVQQIESRGEQWYRVRVGPFQSKRELNKVRNRIQAADIDTMVVRIKREQ